MPGATTFKVLLMVPWVVPVVVSTTAWNWLIATSSSPVPRLEGESVVRSQGGNTAATVGIT